MRSGRTDRVLERMKERKEALTKQQKKAAEKIADEGVSKMREYEQKLDPKASVTVTPRRIQKPSLATLNTKK